MSEISSRQSPPNVLFILTDQQRWDSVGAYGSPMNLTPNLDTMARQGVLFEHAFTCQPVCAPACASLRAAVPGSRLDVQSARWRPSRCGRCAVGVDDATEISSPRSSVEIGIAHRSVYYAHGPASIRKAERGRDG